MAKYVTRASDKTLLELDLLKGHVKYLRDLHSQGILFMCGPLKNSNGKGLLIFEANFQEEVEVTY